MFILPFFTKNRRKHTKLKPQIMFHLTYKYHKIKLILRECLQYITWKFCKNS